MSSEVPERGVRGHGREGDYPDKDVPVADVDTDVGEYTDTDVTEVPRVEPDDGTYTDHDVLEEHREVPVEGSYTDTDVPEAAEHVAGEDPTPEETQHG